MGHRSGAFTTGSHARLALVMLGFAIAVNAATIYVNDDAAGADNGTSWGDAFTHLQDGLAAAQAGDEVWVAAGIYVPTDVAFGAGSFALKNGVGVYGGFAGGETIREARSWLANPTICSGDTARNDDTDPYRADNTDHVFDHTAAMALDATAILDGFTITAGQETVQKGGGMRNVGCSPTIRNCRFFENRGGSGGALYIEDGQVTLVGCAFERNTGHNYGGAIAAMNGGSVAAYGCVFVRNVVEGDVLFGSLRQYGQGSAIYVNGGNVELINCVAAGNTAYQQGAVNIHNSMAALVANCTFSYNTATRDNHGLHYQTDHVESTASIRNCIIWGANQQMSVAGGTYSIDTCCLDGEWPDAGNINTDPLFIHAKGMDDIAGTEDDNLRLRASSPCIDSGSAGTGVPAIDILGRARDAQPDMGAFEYDPAVGAVDYRLAAGYSLIAIPFTDNPVASAADLLAAIPDCSAVYRLNPATQTWDTYATGTGGVDFAILPTEAYFAACTRWGTVTLSGTWPTSETCNLGVCYNLVNLPPGVTAATSANGLLAVVANAQALWRWDIDTQQWSGYIDGLSGDDFPVAPGIPFLVAVDAAGTWPAQ